jgi:hypothetical protein
LFSTTTNCTHDITNSQTAICSDLILLVVAFNPHNKEQEI